jgi:anaphase-promoting complex subunit 4
LAAGWSDGVVRLVGVENNKAVHQVRVVEDGSKAQIQFIAWSRNRTGSHTITGPAKRQEPWGMLLSKGDFELDLDEKQILDLPHELTFLEVDEALPKISLLPVSGGSG